MLPVADCELRSEVASHALCLDVVCGLRIKESSSTLGILIKALSSTTSQALLDFSLGHDLPILTEVSYLRDVKVVRTVLHGLWAGFFPV